MTCAAFVRLLCTTALILMLVPSAFSYDLQTAAEDMDNYFVPAFPPAYSELIDRLPEATVGEIPKVLKALEIFGYLKTLGDVANKVDSGDNLGATLDAATGAVTIAATFLKDEATKRIVVAGFSIGTIPFAAVMTAIDITRKSKEAVDASTAALELERLYYSIQADPLLKVKGRKLGEGEPVRIDATTIEYLWRKVMFDDKWRGLFKQYVTGQLNQDWPEPTTWEKWTISSENLQDAMLLQDRTRLKAHIASLLKELSKVAQKEEARVILAQQLRAIAAMSGNLTPAGLENALQSYQQALKELPSVETYVAGLPEKISGYRARIAKASAAELAQMLESEVLGEMGNISSKARVIRLLTPKGRESAKRLALLTALKKGYADLAAFRNNAARAEVNTRLINESKKLNLAGSEFSFTRHACTKAFEDVKSGFDRKVVTGTADAATEVEKAKADISGILGNLNADYGKDATENYKKYLDALARLTDQRKYLTDTLARTTDSKQVSALYAAINAVNNGIAATNGRYDAYTRLYSINYQVDIENCSGALREIDAFYHENVNRQAIVQGALEEAFRDANAKKWAFYTKHEDYNAKQILPIEELEKLNVIMKNNKDAYAGLSFEFLKKHLVNDKEAPRSQNIAQTVEGMYNAVRTYHDSLYSYSLTYYTDWEKRTLPSLRYMESPAARDAVNTVLAAIDNATTTLAAADPADFAQTFKERYAGMMEELRGGRSYLEEQQKRLARGSGMAASFAAYCDKALRNNSQIAEDAAVIVPVMRAFFRANQFLSVTLATFLYESKDGPPRMLNSAALVKILEETDVLDMSKRLKLGIEDLIKEPFLEMRGKSGLVDIYPEHVKAAIATAQGAPVNDSTQFFKQLYATAGEQGGTAVIMGLLLKSGNTFAAIFQGEPKFAEDAARLYRIFIERREIADKNQDVINERNARFDIVLRRVNQFIPLVQARYDAGDYQGAAGYESFVGDLHHEYQALGATRQNVDDAFASLERLITDSKRKGASPRAVTGVDAAALQAVRGFYDRFQEAYQARDDSRVMSFMGDGWEAGDGTTLADMQVNLSRMFRQFDEMKMEIGNLQVNSTPQGLVVSYDVTITSRIYKKNLRHQEKSAVSELVSVKDGGEVKILRTLNGRYWSVE